MQSWQSWHACHKKSFKCYCQVTSAIESSTVNSYPNLPRQAPIAAQDGISVTWPRYSPSACVVKEPLRAHLKVSQKIKAPCALWTALSACSLLKVSQLLSQDFPLLPPFSKDHEILVPRYESRVSFGVQWKVEGINLPWAWPNTKQRTVPCIIGIKTTCTAMDWGDWDVSGFTGMIRIVSRDSSHDLQLLRLQ